VELLPQNDYDTTLFTEKFLVLGNEETNVTELKIIVRPFVEDLKPQKQFWQLGESS